MTYVSRLTRTAAYSNLINVRLVEVYFHKSPGWDHGESRGIGGLNYQVVSGGVVVQTGSTGDDGKINVPVSGGSSELQLLWGGNAISSFTIQIRDDAWEANSTITGVQRRLRTLGYHLGHAGDAGDGVDGNLGEKTDKAIQDFQIDNNLSFDGQAGSSTRTKLDQQVGGSV